MKSKSSIQISIIAMILLSAVVTAQTPQAFKYQTVVRDAAGEIFQNQNVSFRFNIHDVAPAGAIVYSETHSAVTNEFGLVSLNIGSGVPVSGSFTTINWGSGSKYLEAELDPAGGSSFVSMGTSQLLSVPYALYSENTANNDDADADPDNELQTLAIDGNNLSISDGNSVSLPGSGINNRISDDDGDTWIDVERTGDNDSIIFTTFGMERMKISNNGYVQVSGQMIATGFQGDGSGLTGISGDDLGDHTATGDLNMNGNAITNLDDPQLDSDAANKGYVDSQPGDNLGNHTATDDLDMNWNLISNLVNPINASDAATKGYVDSKPGDNLGNHTATQNLAIGNNWISNDGNIEGIHIDTDGNVGINNAIPDQELTVSGNIRSTDQVLAGFGSSNSASYRFGAGYENSGLASPLANSVAVITDGIQRMMVTQNGNIGIGTNSPANNLHIQGSFRLANGSQANGRILTSDANGTASWTEPTPLVQNEWHTTGNSGTVSGTHFIGTTDERDLDIRTNNLICARFTLKGQIETLNTGRSVFIGENAGEDDDLSINYNTFIGYNSGNKNTSGDANTAIGGSSFITNTTGYFNTALGYQSLFSNMTGMSNVALGGNALRYNTTGDYNTAVGTQALYSNTTAEELTAIGFYSLFANTTGSSNTATGSYSLRHNTIGERNTATGYNALFSNTTGLQNCAYGVEALYSNSTGNLNTATGTSSLYFNTSGGNNSANGFAALYSNISGSGNTAMGHRALYSNTTGEENTSLGYRSMYNNTSGSNNIAIGTRALYSNIDRGQLVAIGDSAMYYNGTGVTEYFQARFNTALGYKSLFSNTTGYSNTANGYLALSSNTTGNWITASGYYALQANTSGISNTAIGSMALEYNTTGSQNTAAGLLALRENINGEMNSAFGVSSLNQNISGNYNTGAGYHSLYFNSTGSYNTAMGYYAFNNGTNYSNSTALGYLSSITASNQVHIGNSSVTSIGGYANWTNLSDARFKKNVSENVPGLSFVLKLKPVTYTLDVEKLNQFLQVPDTISKADDFMINSINEKSAQVQTGFIAQEVESIANELGFDFSGIDKPKNENDHYGLRYAEFVVPLVKAVQEQQLMIEQLKLEIEQLKNERK